MRIWLSNHTFSGFIIMIWVVTLILGNLLGNFIDKMSGVLVFASAAVCFSAVACVEAIEILRILKEKKS